MIEIRCARCRRMLKINDAFAGGVCRCQYCGVIQTVPGRPDPAGGRSQGQPPVRPPSPVDAVLPSEPACDEPRSRETARPRRPLFWLLLAIVLAALAAGWLWYRGLIGANITGEPGPWPMLI